MTTTKKDFWAPFRADFTTFLAQTKKAIAGGFTTAIGTTGAALGADLTAKGGFDPSTAIPALGLLFVGTFVAGFAGVYTLDNK